MWKYRLFGGAIGDTLCVLQHLLQSHSVSLNFVVANLITMIVILALKEGTHEDAEEVEVNSSVDLNNSKSGVHSKKVRRAIFTSLAIGYLVPFLAAGFESTKSPSGGAPVVEPATVETRSTRASSSVQLKKFKD